ncbi:threonylcarbamoyl-AMP synthase [Patescibacteria group bacterium]|nr:threonylcarbamoyl-AMP synthase [Patescibacteria group bacterium]
MQIQKQDNLNTLEIVEELKKGKTLVYPTETVYGLGCDATNQEAVNKIFEIKQRQQDKSVLVLVPSVAMAMSYVEWNEKLEEISQKYWPGPLTVVMKAKPDCGLARGVVAEDGTVAFRVTGHALCAEISEALNRPLVSTSANITSGKSPSDIKDVLETFSNAEFKPDIVIDVGELPHRSPSTVVKIRDGKVIVLRQGELVVE